MNYELRQLNLDNQKETELFVETYLKLFNHPENLKFLSFTGIEFTKKQVKLWVDQSKEFGVEYYVVFDQNKIVALSVLQYNVIEGFELLGIVVSQKYRRKELGKSLIENALKVCKGLGFQSIKVAVFTDNKPMLLLLISLEFIPCEIKYKMRYDGGDVLYFTKKIEDK